MFGDFAIYYNPQGHAILPFIVAPVLQYQDSLIVAPNMVVNHESFVHQVYHTIPNTAISCVYLRAFNYNSRIAITMTFPSRLREDASNRTGLVLTLGALFDKTVFEHYDYPSSRYFNLFLSDFPAIFELDLFKTGTDEVIKLLKKQGEYPELRNKFERLLIHLLKTSNSILQKKKRLKLFSGFRKSLKSFPKMIICSHEINFEFYVNIFLHEVDSYLKNHKLSKIDLASQSFLNEKTLTLLKLDCLPERINKVAMKKSKKQKFIYIY